MELKEAIMRYCRYQERCHSEVRNKLFELECPYSEVDQYLTEMIELGLLNEERFARAFARGRFRMKQWGRQKIKFELKGRKVSDYNIKKGLSEIDPFEYENTLNKLLDKKIAELQLKSRKNEVQRKVYAYMIQKGYERDIVIDMLNEKLKIEKN